MQYSFTLLALVAASTVIAAPLNINMGAYSPALVVGDGEIGFKGTESVANLMSTLQGAATPGAAAAKAAEAAPAAAAGTTTAAAPTTAAAITEPQQGMGKNINTIPNVTKRSEEIEEVEDSDFEYDAEGNEIEKRSAPVEKRQTANFMSALAFASAALKTGPEIQLGTGEGGSGVGITQKAGGTTGTAATANVTARNVEEREVVVLEG